MYVTVLSSHSYWAYITIVLVFASVVVALYSWLAGKSFTRLHRKLALYAFIAIHIQVTVGVVLYFLSPIVQAAFQDFGAAMRDQNLRLYAVEHPLSMIIAMALFTVGYVGLKKVESDKAMHKRIVIFYTLGLIFVLGRLPWAAWL